MTADYSHERQLHNITFSDVYVMLPAKLPGFRCRHHGLRIGQRHLLADRWNDLFPLDGATKPAIESN